jgi:tRNA modification GTPase
VAETIFALATAPGRSAVAVVRVSGQGAGAAVRTLAGRLPRPRTAVLRVLRAPGGGTLDQALVLWFPGPASYTGEDSAELHVHGGPAVIDALIRSLVGLGLRLAEPGEFTRRAFENGKLDLTQAEAVADLVDAETDAQRRQALAQLDGELARRYAGWRTTIIEALAVLEAAVDFPDEELPSALADEAGPALRTMIAELDHALADADRGERVREGYRIALVGAPNAGKSSLLNALTGRDAAIVTAIPGTTRDVVEAPVDLEGFRVLLADTAGLRQTADPVEVEGVKRAFARADDAALRVWVVDGAAANEGWREGVGPLRAGDLCVINKQDLPHAAQGEQARAWALGHGMKVVSLSLTSGAGLDRVRGWITERVVRDLSGAEFPAATRVRHRRDLSEARENLVRALEALEGRGEVELAAEDVRLGARCLSRIGGRVDPEDVLDRVFARFCIGK